MPNGTYLSVLCVHYISVFISYNLIEKKTFLTMSPEIHIQYPIFMSKQQTKGEDFNDKRKIAVELGRGDFFRVS
jgi:hypothetical protein